MIEGDLKLDGRQDLKFVRLLLYIVDHVLQLLQVTATSKLNTINVQHTIYLLTSIIPRFKFKFVYRFDMHLPPQDDDPEVCQLTTVHS